MGSVLFSCVHFGCAFVSACFVAISQNTEDESTQDVLYKIGMLVTFSSAIISIFLFFIGNYQFRLSMLKLLKKLFCFFTPTATETTVVRTRIFVTPPAPLHDAVLNSVNASVINGIPEANRTNGLQNAEDLSSSSVESLNPCRTITGCSCSHLASKCHPATNQVQSKIIGSISTNEGQDQRRMSSRAGTITKVLCGNSVESDYNPNDRNNKKDKPTLQTKNKNLNFETSCINSGGSQSGKDLGENPQTGRGDSHFSSDSDMKSENSQLKANNFTPEIVITDERGDVLWRFSKKPLARVANNSKIFGPN